MNRYYEDLIQEIVRNGYIILLKNNKDFEIMIQLENNDISNRMDIKINDIEKAYLNDMSVTTLSQLIQGKFLDYIIGGIY